MDSIKYLARNTRKLMDYHNFTQTGLAKKSGISQRTISNIVNADRLDTVNITQYSIERLAAAFNMPAWLLVAIDIPKELLNKPAADQLDQFVRKYAATTTRDRDMIAHILSLV